jgi:hypothetical protein
LKQLAADQIREALTHNNHLSQNDIDFCLGFDLAPLSAHASFAQIRDLHQTLRSSYGESE